MATVSNGKHTFEIVDRIPKGYNIWNIGAVEEYLPLCEPEDQEGFSYKVNVNTLKAIKCDKAQEIMWLAVQGINTPEKVKERLLDPDNHRYFFDKNLVIRTMQEVLPIMEKIFA